MVFCARKKDLFSKSSEEVQIHESCVNVAVKEVLTKTYVQNKTPLPNAIKSKHPHTPSLGGGASATKQQHKKTTKPEVHHWPSLCNVMWPLNISSLRFSYYSHALTLTYTFLRLFFLRLSLAGPIRAVHFPHDPGDVDQGLLLPQVYLGPVAVERVHFLRSVHELLHPELQEETHPRAEHRQRSGKGERRINDDASHRGQEGQLRRKGEFHLTNQDTERLFIISWIQLLCIDEYEYRNVRFRLGVDI